METKRFIKFAALVLLQALLAFLILGKTLELGMAKNRAKQNELGETVWQLRVWEEGKELTPIGVTYYQRLYDARVQWDNHTIQDRAGMPALWGAIRRAKIVPETAVFERHWYEQPGTGPKAP